MSGIFLIRPLCLMACFASSIFEYFILCLVWKCFLFESFQCPYFINLLAKSCSTLSRCLRSNPVDKLMNSICIPVFGGGFLQQDSSVFVQNKSSREYLRQNFSADGAFREIHRCGIPFFFYKFTDIFFLVHHRNKHEIHLVFPGFVEGFNGGPFFPAWRTPGSPKIQEYRLLPFKIFEIGIRNINAFQHNIVGRILLENNNYNGSG